MVLTAKLMRGIRNAAGDPWIWVGSVEPEVIAAGQSHRMALVHALRSGLVDLPVAVLTHRLEPRPEDGAYWRKVAKHRRGVPVALVWAGNEMNTHFLFEHDVPFTIAGIERGADKVVVPAEMVKAFCLQLLEQLPPVLNAMGPRNVVLVGPPPPKRDETVRERLPRSPFFSAALKSRGWTTETAPVTPFSFRLKLWEIHRSAMGDTADLHGIALLGIPEVAVDEDGALRDEYAADDASHANGRYGGLVWRLVSEHFGAEARS